MAGKLLDQTRRLFKTWRRHDKILDEGRHRSFVMHRDKYLDIAVHTPDVSETRPLAERFAVVECEDGSRYDMSQN